MIDAAKLRRFLQPCKKNNLANGSVLRGTVWDYHTFYTYTFLNNNSNQFMLYNSSAKTDFLPYIIAGDIFS